MQISLAWKRLKLMPFYRSQSTSPIIDLSLNYKIKILNIEATKLELMNLLLQTNNESVLTKLKVVFEEEAVDWWNDMSTNEREEIKTGLKQADNGNFISNEMVMKQFDKEQ